MSTRDSTEGNPRRYAISEDAETERIGRAHLCRELIARGGEVLSHRDEFAALRRLCVIDEERILMLEASEEPLELGEYILI